MKINACTINPAFSGKTKQNKNVTEKIMPKQVTPFMEQKPASVSFSGAFLSSIFAKKVEKTPPAQNPPSEFATEISKGIKDVMDVDIPPENFHNIVSPNELREILPQLKETNFVCSKENIAKGVYIADLDYQSKYSCAKENVYQILDDVAVFANKYHKKTGKDLIFALTDRDALDGLQQTVRIFGENPHKFQHVKLVPAVKISYAHEAPESKLKFENSDMLIYGVNPYSKNIINFLDSTVNSRKKMSVNFIRQVNELYPEFSYNIKEFSIQNRLKYKRDYTVSNLYWRAREYAERKGGSAITGELPPEQILLDADDILDNMEELYIGSDFRSYSAQGSDIITEEKVNKDIEKVFKDYSTHYDENKGKVVSTAENLYDEMIDSFASEPQKPVLAFASPYYFSHYFSDNKSVLTEDTMKKVTEFMQNLRDKSQGMLIAFESLSPGYDLDVILGKDTIEKFNNYIRENTDLYEVGGTFAKRKESEFI